MNLISRVVVVFLLMFFGVAHAANVLIVHDGTAGLEANVVTNLSAKFVTHGDTVTTNVGVPVSLAGYQQVWDVRFDNTTPLTPSDISKYVAFMAAGGSLFVIGENTGFITRDNSIASLVAAAGGGTISITAAPNLETVRAPFTGPNAISTITFQAAAGFNVLGSQAAPIAYDPPSGIAAAAVWGPGAMSAAASGSLIVVFDVNFLDPGADATSQLFTANLIAYLAAPTRVSPLVGSAGIPTLSEWGMIVLSLLIAVFAFVQMRRRNGIPL